MSNNNYLSDFRLDMRSILAYGVFIERQETLKQLEEDIARYEKGGR